MSRQKTCRWGVLVPVLLLLIATGCSGRVEVTGRVLYEDGTPVEGGTVIGEATVNGKLVAVQGNINPDGTFTLGGEKPGDGALPGSYRILVMPVALGDSELAEGKIPAVGSKYGRFETSGLTLEVTTGKNELNIKVPKPKKGK